MNKKNKPTLFIDTVSTEIKNNSSQTVYDSRSATVSTKWVPKKNITLIERKLDGILNLVNKGNLINVYLELNDSYVEGILKEKRDNKIIISIYNKEEAINLELIKDIIILND